MPPEWTTWSGRRRAALIPRVCSTTFARSSSSAWSTAETKPTGSARAPTQGKVARYARGADYHRVLWDRLEALLDWLRDRVAGNPRPCRRRHGAAAGARLRPAGRAGLDRQEHDADQPPAGQLHLPGRTSDRCRAGLRPAARGRITAEPARAASTPARPRRSPAPTSSTPAAASATGPSSTAVCSPKRPRPSFTAGSSAATSARTCARGTARPRPAD